MAIQLYRPPQVPDSRDMHNDDRHSSDDDKTESDTSDDVVEVPPEEIPGYFQERGGRLFHSHGGCPYPLPVDAEEQQVSRAPSDSCPASSVTPLNSIQTEIYLLPRLRLRLVSISDKTG